MKKQAIEENIFSLFISFVYLPMEVSVSKIVAKNTFLLTLHFITHKLLVTRNYKKSYFKVLVIIYFLQVLFFYYISNHEKLSFFTLLKGINFIHITFFVSRNYLLILLNLMFFNEIDLFHIHIGLKSTFALKNKYKKPLTPCRAFQCVCPIYF